jgi:hypothetical protein
MRGDEVICNFPHDWLSVRSRYLVIPAHAGIHAELAWILSMGPRFREDDEPGTSVFIPAQKTGPPSSVIGYFPAKTIAHAISHHRVESLQK